jgi:precorrin-6B methylase 2
MPRTLNALFLALCLPALATGCSLERQPQVPQARAVDAAVAASDDAATAPAAAPDGYTRIRRSRDGIGKAYMGREIAAVMGWQGAAWLEREEREREERGSVLLQELRLAPGMQVADIGAGTGWYARRMAPMVVPGRVYAVDVQPQMVAMLQRVAVQPGLANVVPVLGGERDSGLAPGSIDLALMVDVYHELAYPAEMLDALAIALKPGGRLVLVEYRAEDDAVPIKPMHKMSQAQIRREVTRHGLAWERTADSLPWQHVVVFRKAE